MRGSSICLVISAGALTLGGCSEQTGTTPSGEVQVHDGENAVAIGMPGRHPYRCDDDRMMLVAFRDRGLTIELRRDARGVPVVLTASAQGQPYVGGRTRATVSGKMLSIAISGRRSLLCRKGHRPVSDAAA